MSLGSLNAMGINISLSFIFKPNIYLLFIQKLFKAQKIFYKNNIMFLNFYNYKSFIKIFLVFDSPFQFIFLLLSKKVPSSII